MTDISDRTLFSDQAGPWPRFAIAMRGYDRTQVDTWLREHERQLSEVMAVTQTMRRARALEARVSELERESPDPQPLGSLADFVLGRAREVARELPGQVTKQAEADRAAAEMVAAEAIESAQERSAEIVGEARRDHGEVATMADEARKQLDAFREQGVSMARERAQAKWADATGDIAELVLELARLRQRRRAVLSELAELGESVAASKALLRERRATHLGADKVGESRAWP